MSSEKKHKKSVFESPVLSTKIKTANVKLFPEAAFGYLLGPIFALIANAVVNTYLVQYWTRVLGLADWAPVFMTVLPIISTIIVILGNTLVGRLMERKPSLAGKARPLILLGLPLIVVALFVLFYAPFPTGATADSPAWATLVMITIGYNLYYAFAFPFYYTSHSALVNLSTRNSGGRSLLATCSNGAQVAASGLAGMIGPFLIDALGLLPVGENGGLASEADRIEANNKWVILMAILIVCLCIGCLLEYFFTRERITEENIKLAEKETNEVTNKKLSRTKKIPLSEQIKICVHDKYWWFIIIFFLLYQLGGMLKNNDLSWFSQAFLDGKTALQGTINIVGAIPTALGMLAIWPLAHKFGKANCIKVGAIFAVITGLLGFVCIPLGEANNVAGIYGVSITAFCLKAIGTVPAMYISMALMSDVLDRQEAVFGKRTDGFTMSVYGSIMVSMTGIANGIIIGLNNAFGTNNQILHTSIFFGGEVFCYLIIGIMFLFMNVEKFTNISQKSIINDQRRYAEENGLEFIEPHERMLMEEAESNKQILDEKKEELRIKCEKKGLNYEEELVKFNEQLKAKEEASIKAKEEKAAKAENAKAKKLELEKAKYDALSETEKAKYDAKKEAKIKKEADIQQHIEDIFAKDRAKYYGKF